MVSIGNDQDFSWLTSTLASGATDSRGILAEWVRPIQSGRHAVGYAIAVMAMKTITWPFVRPRWAAR